MALTESVIREAERQIRHFLQPVVKYIDDDGVNEVMINAPNTVFVERSGKCTKLDVELNERDILGAISSIATLNDKDVGYLTDARLEGIRVAAVTRPVAVHGPAMAIRRLVTHRQTMDEFLERGDFDIQPHYTADLSDEVMRRQMETQAAKGGQGLVEFLHWLMISRQNTLIGGGTSSGKTTLAAGVLGLIPQEHRLVICEDNKELTLWQPNLVQLEAKSSHDPAHAVTLRHLVKMCLRLRPDRIIVGEARGAEIFDLLDAGSTGHPGIVFTMHGDGAAECLYRAETLLRMAPEMAQATTQDIRQIIARTVRYVIYQSRRGHQRAPEAVIFVDPELDKSGNYVTRPVYNRYPRIT